MASIRSPRRPAGARGATLVEFALLLPLFALLLFGMITVGLALNERQQITHATREGARYASTVAASQEFTSGTWATNVRDLIVERSVGTLGEAEVCVSLVEGSPGTVVEPTADHSTTGTPCIADQTHPVTTNDDGRRVQVTASHPATIDLVLFGEFVVTMDAEATARSESDS
jgi:Flp pilus assembly protein TadG